MNRTSALKRTVGLRRTKVSFRTQSGKFLSFPALQVFKKRPKKAKPSTFAPWIKAIPESQSHGSGSLQKRLWRLTSDYVRIRDWHKYGICVATGRKVASWREGQAGHFISYSKCNGLFKFHPLNIHLQSARSNSWGDRDDWKQYEITLGLRYQSDFPGIVEYLEMLNKKSSLKFTNEEIFEQMKYILKAMRNLPEQPEYYARVISLTE